MPTTHISPIRSMRTRLEYVTYGSGDERERRIASGETRWLAQTCDLADISTTYRVAREARLAHAARRNEGYEVRLSWSPEELSPDDPEHVERAMAFGHTLMSALFPNCPVVITAHGDGVGHCLHLHCDVVNQDFETGRAIKGPSLNHKTIVAVSDRLAEEWGMSKPTARPSRWAERRASLEARIEQAEESLDLKSKLPRSYVQDIVALHHGDIIDEVLDDESVTDMATFENALRERGIDIVRKPYKGKDGETREGLVYKGQVEVAGKTRSRRLKASAVAEDFDTDHIEQTIAARVAERERQAAEAAAEAERARLAAEEAERKRNEENSRHAGSALDAVAEFLERKEAANDAKSEREKLTERRELAVSEKKKVLTTRKVQNGVYDAIPLSELMASPEVAEASAYSLDARRFRRVVSALADVANEPRDDDGLTRRMLSSMPEPAQAWQEYAREYGAAARRLIKDDTDTEGASFVDAALDRVVNFGRRVWCRVVAFAENVFRRSPEREFEVTSVVREATQHVMDHLTTDDVVRESNERLRRQREKMSNGIVDEPVRAGMLEDDEPTASAASVREDATADPKAAARQQLKKELVNLARHVADQKTKSTASVSHRRAPQHHRHKSGRSMGL